jgi:hypothetical protein
VRLAWAAQCALFVWLCAVVILVGTRAERLRTPSVWASEVIGGSVAAQGLKVLLLEPACALAVPLLALALRKAHCTARVAAVPLAIEAAAPQQCA